MVIGRKCIGGNFGAETFGIALADRIFICYGTYNDALCALDQTTYIEPFVEIPLQITQSRMMTFSQPTAKDAFVVCQMAAGRHSAKVETYFKGLTYNILSGKHGNNLAQI